MHSHDIRKTGKRSLWVRSTIKRWGAKMGVYRVLACKNELLQLIFRDITYTRQLEAQQIQLKQSLETFKNLLHNVSDAIATLDNEFYFKIINPSFIRFF